MNENFKNQTLTNPNSIEKLLGFFWIFNEASRVLLISLLIAKKY